MRRTFPDIPSRLGSPGAAHRAETRGLAQQLSGKFPIAANTELSAFPEADHRAAIRDRSPSERCKDPGSSRSGLAAGTLVRGREWREWIQGVEIILAAVVVLFFTTTSGFAQKAGKPRVPPGVDPGGVAIAIIGGGIDYTRPEIAARLARDGEGEIVGWDFIDNDRRPFAVCNHRAGGHIHCDQGPILVITELEASARFIVTRVDPSKPQMMVDAMRLIGGTAARIVVFGDRIPFETGQNFAVEAGRRYERLLILAAGAAGDLAARASRPPDNVIFTSVPSIAAGTAAREITTKPGITTTELRRILAAQIGKP